MSTTTRANQGPRSVLRVRAMLDAAYEFGRAVDPSIHPNATDADVEEAERLFISKALDATTDERVAAALALHVRIALPAHHRGGAPDICRTCWDASRPGYAIWPCPTVRTLS